MVIRQLKQYQYDYLNQSLLKRAHAEPLDASYNVTMFVNGAEYIIKVQPERHCKVAILHILRIYRDKDGPNFELITQGNLLSSFLEILIYQGIA